MTDTELDDESTNPDYGPWGVYEDNVCTRCGKKIVIVATVASVEGGYAEAFQSPLVCQTCKDMRLIGVN